MGRVARSTALVLAVVTASKTATIFLSSVVVVATGSTPRGSSNVARFGGVSSTFGIRAVESNNAALTMSIPRGGDEPGVEKLTKEKDGNENDNEEDIVETLYLPGLLHASVSRKTDTGDAITDCTVILNHKKAKELGVSSGDVVAIVGRRRKANHAIVSVAPRKQKAAGGVSVSGCALAYNLANN